ncbi:aminopeptidase [Candidatus Woesearchaeota archaeon]|nr:aminopeptidase [Candidatus Woesearchaeota archaeon]
MNKLQKGAKAALLKSIALKSHESLLVVTDTRKFSLAMAFFIEANKLTKNTKLISMAPRKVNGEEPPADIVTEMKKYDALLLITDKSLSHTRARINASRKGARIASMPGITKEIIERCLDADYDRIKKLTNKLADIVDKASSVRITTKKGTDISFSIRGRKSHGRNSGIFKNKGEWGNLPEGEVCLAPVEGTANGIIVCDTTDPMKNELLSKSITIKVKNGFAVYISDKNIFSELKKLGKNSLNVAELGIGTNYKARISGNVIEDEKVLGTCHIALGNSLSLGGKVHAKSHLDFVLREPTILLDEKVVMSEGKLRK